LPPHSQNMDKFPSIAHLAFSPQINDDDIVLGSNVMLFGGSSEIVIHEKLDGGNCCVFKGNVYARTHKHPAKHPWFDTIRMMVKSNGPPNLFYEHPYFEYMIFGENMTAVHSIEYNNVSSYFYIFAVYDPKTKMWLDVDATASIANALHLPTAPLLFRGTFSSMNAMREWMKKEIKKSSALGSKEREGFVVRTSGAFKSEEFVKCIAKYVRAGHVQTDKQWSRKWKKARVRQDMDYHSPQNHHGHSAHNESAVGPSRSVKTRASKGKRSKVAVSFKTSLIICVGLPGSGKSTFCRKLVNERDEWQRIGTDLVKEENAKNGVKSKRNIAAVFDVVSRRIKRGQKVIVENCNLTTKKRLELLDCAFKPKDAVCLFFDVDIDECKRRVSSRRGHETKDLFVGSSKSSKISYKGSRIIDSFAKTLERPTTKEGFKQVIVVQNDADIERMLARLGVRGSIESANGDTVEEEKKEEVSDLKERCHESVGIRKTKDSEMNLYDAPMARSQDNAMSLKTICRKLDLEEDDVLNCYVVGSRVWDSSSSKSKWHMLLVTESEGHKTSQSVDNIDAIVWDKGRWIEELRKYRFVCWVTLFLPSAAIWKHEFQDIVAFDAKEFAVAYQKEVNRDCKKIKLFLEKKIYKKKAQRTFLNGFRNLQILKQIIALIVDEDGAVDIAAHSYVGAIRFDALQTPRSKANEMEEMVQILRSEMSDCLDLC